MEESPRIKGSALLGVLAWVGDHLGRDVRQQMVTNLDRSWGQVFARRIRSTDWYPYGAYAALLQAVEERLLTSESHFTLQDVGRWTSKLDLRGILKIVAAFSSPEAAVVRGFGVWGKSYWSRFCDVGSVSLIHHHADGATIALDRFNTIAEQHCTLMEGWWAGVVEGVGAREPKVYQKTCVHRGDARCEFVGVWR